VYHLGNCKSILCLVVAAVITVILGRIVVYSTCFGVLSDNDDAENAMVKIRNEVLGLLKNQILAMSMIFPKELRVNQKHSNFHCIYCNIKQSISFITLHELHHHALAR